MTRTKKKIDSKLRRFLPNSLADFLSRSILEKKNLFYGKMKISKDSIKNESYKNFFGGKAKQWEKRGAFQLFFLKKMGLQPSSNFLDIGCGPIRAGVHFIDFLDKGKYCGVDYNEDFIFLAIEICSEEAKLNQKEPSLSVINDFNFSSSLATFDFAMAFSVLNHCSEREKDFFFEHIETVIKPGTRVFITHAEWFDDSFLEHVNLRKIRSLSRYSDLGNGFDFKDWGWTDKANPFPIVELESSDSIGD